MSRQLVGPFRVKLSNPGATLEFSLERPERTQPPHLRFYAYLTADKDARSSYLLSPMSLSLTFNRLIAPGATAGAGLRLPLFMAQSYASTLEPKATAWCEFEIPVDPATVQKLDELRGEKYGLQIDGKVRMPFAVLGPEGQVSTGGTAEFPIKLALNNAHWRELLELWEWPSIRVFELRASSFPSLKSFAAAAGKLTEAQRALEQGDARTSIVLSREVVDAVLNSIHLDDHHTERHEQHGPRRGRIGPETFRAAGLPGAFWSLYVDLTQIADEADGPEADPWSPSEARMMLALAAGMAEHLGTVLQRARPQRP